MVRDSLMRERIFFPPSDPHGAAPQHERFLTGMPDDDLLQRSHLGLPHNPRQNRAQLSHLLHVQHALPPTLLEQNLAKRQRPSTLTRLLSRAHRR